MVIDMVRLLYGVGNRTLTYTVCLDSWARNSSRHGTCGNRSIILFFNARRFDATQTLRKMVIDMVLVRFLYSGGIEPEHLSNARSSGRPYAKRSYTWYVFCIAWGFEPEHFINARSNGRRYEKWSFHGTVRFLYDVGIEPWRMYMHVWRRNSIWHGTHGNRKWHT